MLQKLYPSCVGTRPSSSFKLIFLAEGYASTQRGAFMSACADFYDWLCDTPPFNSTQYNPGWLTVLAGWPPSTAAPCATVSGSSLAVNAANVVARITPEKLRNHGSEQALPNLVRQGAYTMGTKGALIVLLLPSAGSGLDAEHIAAAGEYPFIAVTTDAYWQQVVLRALCGVLALGDESELSGPQAPTAVEDKILLPNNLAYFDSASGGPPAGTWTDLLPPGSVVVVHTHPHPATPDLAFDLYPTSPDNAEFFPGGLGFRADIYRSARDCLMRRRIGDSSRPLRVRPVPLCAVCRNHLRNVIG